MGVGIRFGLTILPEYSFAQAAPKWRAAQDMGFDHAWTYDHLTWSGLPESPWYAAIPTLTAAAVVTSRIRLGTFVASPNFRHPGPFAQEIRTLDDISAGRVVLGLGTGGDADARKLAGPQLSVRQRVDRFQEFVTLLDLTLREDHVTYDGAYFSAADLRAVPGCVQQPWVPFVVAANGPRSMRLAARFGQGWATTGRRGETQEDWWRSLAQLSATFDEVAGECGGMPRYLQLDAGPEYSMSSVDHFEDAVGRAAELGFTDLVTHWPRADASDAPYAGDEATLERVAADVIPRWQAATP